MRRQHRFASVFLCAVLTPTVAHAVHWAPVGEDGVSPAEHALRHSVVMAWTNSDSSSEGMLVQDFDPAHLIHVVEQSPGSSSFASTSVEFEAEDSAGFSPADLIVRLPIGDPHRGVRSIAQTTAEIEQISVTGQLATASAAPGEEPTTSDWRFRLEPTGSEIAGEPIQIRAYASIDGQTAASGTHTTSSRILAEFTVNGQTILASETISTQNDTVNDVDESAQTVLAGTLGSIIEIGMSVRTDALVVGPGPRLASGDATGLRFDIEIRLVRELADLNNDGIVDTADLGILIANFGMSGTNFDLNSDGIIDTADLGLLISVFGMLSI